MNCGVRLVIRRNGNSALSVPGLRVKGGQGWPCLGGCDATPRPPKVGYPLTADLNVRPNVRTKTEGTVFNATAQGLLPPRPSPSHHAPARRNGPK